MRSKNFLLKGALAIILVCALFFSACACIKETTIIKMPTTLNILAIKAIKTA